MVLENVFKAEVHCKFWEWRESQRPEILKESVKLAVLKLAEGGEVGELYSCCGKGCPTKACMTILKGISWWWFWSCFPFLLAETPILNQATVNYHHQSALWHMLHFWNNLCQNSCIQVQQIHSGSLLVCLFRWIRIILIIFQILDREVYRFQKD